MPSRPRTARTAARRLDNHLDRQLDRRTAHRIGRRLDRRRGPTGDYPTDDYPTSDYPTDDYPTGDSPTGDSPAWSPRGRRARAPLAATLACALGVTLVACSPADDVPAAAAPLVELLEDVPGVDGVEVTTPTDTTGPTADPSPDGQADPATSDGTRVTFWVDVGPALDGDAATAAHAELVRAGGALAWDVWFQDGPRDGEVPARRSVHADATGIAPDAFRIAHSPGVVSATIDGPRSSVRTSYADQLVAIASGTTEGGTPLTDLGAAGDTLARGHGGAPSPTLLMMLAEVRDVPGFVGSAYDDAADPRGTGPDDVGHLVVVAADDASARAVADVLDQGGWAAATHPVAYVVQVGSTPPDLPGATPSAAEATDPASTGLASTADGVTGWVSTRDPAGTPASDPDTPCGSLTGHVTGQDSAMGRRWLTIVMTNDGQEPCELAAVPDLRFRTLAGELADVGRADEDAAFLGPDQPTTREAVSLAPGASTSLAITWRGGSTSLDPDVTVAIEVVPNPDAAPVVVPLTDPDHPGPATLDVVDGVTVTAGGWRP
ncbi:uncharacterized protein DUF4232 [Sediminihabitans luteus]|uniref:Uncharacterized protein DUF4232 n=1 Tax=Sediminihabitans luteus TaxID=1138585 RepID=A0A2M9CEL6_9CELL|nr:DUF4232 domain-containing protein [Sediminihabitans luteus]PJJ70317.1 uncharacterized protein DUF4232 [Sediminihabitans luteus]GII97788.1 hypothetical protein Slu03_01660 [Sediminihabitans luteus]